VTGLDHPELATTRMQVVKTINLCVFRRDPSCETWLEPLTSGVTGRYGLNRRPATAANHLLEQGFRRQGNRL
jgi:hypothetical protein